MAQAGLGRSLRFSPALCLASWLPDLAQEHPLKGLPARGALGLESGWCARPGSPAGEGTTKRVRERREVLWPGRAGGRSPLSPGPERTSSVRPDAPRTSQRRAARAHHTAPYAPLPTCVGDR